MKYPETARIISVIFIAGAVVYVMSADFIGGFQIYIPL